MFIKHKSSAFTIGLLSLLSLIYFICFIPANNTGSNDLSMLGVRNLDERQQYINFEPMTHFGQSLRETANIVLRDTYLYYGYAFFASSILVVSPIHYFVASSLPIDMLILRQLSVAWSLASIWVVTYCLTQFASRWKSLLCFTFLLMIPAVVENNLWWHPDALVALLICLSLFCLQRDRWRCGRWFILAAIVSGLATAIKLVGIFLAPTVVVYLLIAHRLYKKKIWEVSVLALVFACTHITTFVLANPFLFHAIDRAEYLQTQIEQIGRLQNGWVLGTTWTGWLLIVNSWFFGWGIVIVALLGICTSAWQKHNQDLRCYAWLTLTWALPYLGYLIWRTEIQSWKYILPIMLPLLSFMPSGIEFIWRLKTTSLKRSIVYLSVGLIAISLLPALQLDYENYLHRLQFASNPSIQFYENFSHQLPTPLACDMVIYNDWGVYLPDSLNVVHREKFGTFYYPDIATWEPDYILLSKANIQLYTMVDEHYVESDAAEFREFYEDVKHGQVKGYTTIYEDDFGVALKKLPPQQ